MSEKIQLTFDDDPVYKQYQDTFLLIRQGKFNYAYHALDEVLKHNINLPIIYTMMKCLKFWANREERIVQLEVGKDTAIYLENEWLVFEEFLIKHSLRASRIVPLIKESIFTNVIDHYIRHFQNLSAHDPELLVKIAESFLAIRSYKKARDTLLYAKKFRKKDSQILAYLGECYYFLKEETKAIAYYREAFFINPKSIRIDKLHSPVITSLIRKVADHGFRGMEINLWLPVYAEIENLFKVKRELRESERETLQKQIYHYEIQYEVNFKKRNEIEPLLINYYINLLDFFKVYQQDPECLQTKNILRKLKSLNEEIYLKIRKHYE